MKVICRAINSIRNKNGIVTHYILQDIQGNTMRVQIDQIKNALKNNLVLIPNLKLTSNGRLINVNIEIPKRFTEILNKISDMSGVEHTKPTINEFYFVSKFSKESEIKATLDMSSIALFKNGKAYNINKNTISNIVQLIKGDKQEVKDNRNIKIIHITKDMDEVNLQFNDSTLNLIIKVNKDYEHNNININESTLKSIQVYSDCEENRDKTLSDNISVTIRYSEIDQVNIAGGKLRLLGSLINSIDAIETTVRFIQDSYANKVTISNQPNIYMGEMKCNELIVKDANYNMVYIVQNSLENNCAIINNLKIYSKAFLCTIIASCMYTKSIEIPYIERVELCMESPEFVVNDIISSTYEGHIEALKEQLSLDSQNNSIDSEKHNRCVKALSIYNKIYNILKNEENISNWVTNININSEVQINALMYPCTANFSADASLVDKPIIAGILSSKVIDKLTIKGKGLIYLHNNINLFIKDLVIQGITDTCCIKVLNNLVKNFSLTIANSIRITSNTHIKTIAMALKKISDIQPIGVYYGTQAYDFLISQDVKVNILNKEDIDKDLINRKYKEELLGINMLDDLAKNIKSACNNYKPDNDICAIDTGYSIPVPDSVLSLYKLEVMENSNQYASTRTKNIIDILKLFDMCNLPFSKEIITQLQNGVNYKVKSASLYAEASITIYRIYVASPFDDKTETYIAAFNGRNLIYMIYMADYTFKVNYGPSNNDFEVIDKLSKIESIDFKTMSLRQSVTLSKCKNTSELLHLINDYIVNYIPLIHSNDMKNAVIFGTNLTPIFYKCSSMNARQFGFNDMTQLNRIVDFKSLNRTNSTLDKIKFDLRSKLYNSVCIKILNEKKNCDGTIAKCEKSWLMDECKNFKKDLQDTSEDTIMMLFNSYWFNEISKKEFDKLYKSSKTCNNNIIYNNNEVKIEKIFHNRRKSSSNLDGYIINKYYLYIVTKHNKKIYYVSDSDLTRLVKNIHFINTEYRHSNYSMEDYISDLNWHINFKIKNDALNDFSIAKLAMSISMIPVAIGSITMTDSEATNERNLYNKTQSIGSNLLALWQSSSALKDDNKVCTQTMIVMCKITGFLYVAAKCKVKTGGMLYIIPVLRISDMDTAMKLRKRLSIVDESDKTLRIQEGLMQDIGWYCSDALCKTMELQYNNIKDVNEYPDKYKYLVSYVEKN